MVIETGEDERGRKIIMGKQEDMINKFGEIIDKQLKENEINMVITLPEGSMDAEIRSSYDGIEVMNFYILLHALKKVVGGVIEQANVDEDKLEDMLDGMFEMVKNGILEEYKKE